MRFLINLIKEESPPHKHNVYEILIYTKGSGVFHAAGKEIAAVPGKIIVIPPGTVHHSSASAAAFERIYINGEFSQVFNLASPTVILDNSEKEGLLLAKMIYANRHAEYEYVVALINAFTHFLLQNIKMDNEIFLATKDIIEKISNDFYNCNLTLRSLLKKSGYAEDYIRAQFKKITGKTPTEFLTEIRIAHACHLINTYKNAFSLSDVAEKCGFTDYVYFSRRFKHIMGVSPRKYMESL
ncbi:MAG: helix-turn-helix domain-containing protein [Ruminococcaceae bacterium]|nr:helix-turn-helix domain-containing protein [Oscillospiraceae bacterium]